MSFSLSLNTNPLVNRFAEPEDLIMTIAYEIGLRDLQLTHEFLNPSWPSPALHRLTKRLEQMLAQTGVRITSGMTGPSGRLNHFGHPDADIRAYYVDWFSGFAQLIADLGGRAIGTQFAILSYRDFDDPKRRSAAIDAALSCWCALAEQAAYAGLEFLFWEPMSVGREFGETITACRTLQDRIEACAPAIPIWIMTDIDHGDITAPDPSDSDPYAWARATASRSPIVHIKQSLMDKSGHRPFTAAFNAGGRIQPEKLLAALREGGGSNNELCLELSFRERDPSDRQVIAEIAESVEFWAPHIETGAAALTTAKPSA